MSENKELFLFATKAGALEGYLYERENLESLDNWVSNVEKMYASLPDNIKGDIKGEFGKVLQRTLEYGEKSIGEEIRTRLNNILLAL